MFKKLLVLLCISLTAGKEKDYYELLGVSRDADTKEIRKAFKKLAVNLHPDKNPDDADAHSVFIKLTQAYEVLKDPALRKTYDMYGEEKIGARQHPQYHSYTYYRDHFGIYDDDPEVITLNKADFEMNILGSGSRQWFVNFYSPLCSHCHELAPTWRALARELQGVIMFGAVNCEDEWALCRQQNIRAYPSLIFYPKAERYSDKRTKESLFNYIMENVDVDITHVQSPDDWDLLMKSRTHRSWVLMLCESNDLPSCPMGDDRTKLAAILSGLVGVAVVNCHLLSSCSSMTDGIKSSVVYWQKAPNGNSWSARSIRSSHYNPQDVLKEVLDYLPDLIQLDSDGFKDMNKELETDSNSLPWLVYFHIGASSELDLDVKKLPAMLPEMRVGRVNCGRHSDICVQVSVNRYPSFAVFKRGGGYEFYHGQSTAHSIANFAKESAAATNLWTLTNKEFPSLVMGQDGSGGAWFIDFYAPWCPPCMRLLPEFRKASRMFDESVRFGTVDCTIHEELCRQHNVQAYPTTVLYNSTRPVQRFRGKHLASSISDFLMEFVNPQLQELDAEMFDKLVGEKKSDTFWLIAFNTPNHHQLHTEIKKLAHLVTDFPNVFVGEVNCVREVELCSDLSYYPVLRLYPSGNGGISTYIDYNSKMRFDSSTLRRWLFQQLPEYVEELTPERFQEEVMESIDDSWIVDFYSPSCGHCVVFEPDFITVAFKMKGKIRSGKVNCQKYYNVCYKAGIRAYPTVIFYSPESTRHQGQEITSHTINGIIEFINDMLSSATKRPSVSRKVSDDGIHDEL